jgi:hypothetical protein
LGPGAHLFSGTRRFSACVGARPRHWRLDRQRDPRTGLGRRTPPAGPLAPPLTAHRTRSVITRHLGETPGGGIDGAPCRLDDDMPLPGLLVGPSAGHFPALTAVLGRRMTETLSESEMAHQRLSEWAEKPSDLASGRAILGPRRCQGWKRTPSREGSPRSSCSAPGWAVPAVVGVGIRAAGAGQAAYKVSRSYHAGQGQTSLPNGWGATHPALCCS